MKAVWRKLKKDYWQYHDPRYAVFGTVEKEISPGIPMAVDFYCWSAIVVNDCRMDGLKPIKGKTRSLKKAKHVVEVLLKETDTLSKNGIES